MAEPLEFYTPQQVAEMFSVTQWTAVRLGKSGKLPGLYRLWDRGRWRFSKSKIDAYVASGGSVQTRANSANRSKQSKLSK